MIQHSKRLAALVAVAGLVVPVAGHATNGYQLIGIGSHQKGMGGAVTAVPRSAMTAITNPAGMARIGTRADFNLELFMPERFVDFSATGGEKQESATTMYGVPALGWTAPVSDENPDVYFGGGMFGTSGMGVDYGSVQIAPTSPLPGNPPVYFDGYSSISFWQMAPTLAWNVDKRLSLGVSLNLDYQSVAFKQRTLADTNGDGTPETTVANFDLSRQAQGFGMGLSFGALYDVNDALTLGVSYKSRQEFSDMEYQLASGDILNMPGASGCNVVVPGIGTACPAGTYKLELDYPQQAAIGIAIRPMKGLTVAADVKWIDWSSTMNELVIHGSSGARVVLPAGWEDQMIYALGVEYAATPRLNLRAGFNYAEAPFGDDEVSANLILPATVETHYTVGADYRLNKHWELAFHYMQTAEKVFTAPATDPNVPGAKIGLEEKSFGVNLGYLF